MVIKKELEETQRKYLQETERFQNIIPSQMIWDCVGRGGLELDYHPAVVARVNVDERYVDVIDVSDGNKEKRFHGFYTETELLKEGFTVEIIRQERERYKKTIESVLSQPQ